MNLAAGFIPRTALPLAARADAEEFQLVRHGFEAVCRGDAPFNFLRETFLDFHDVRALRANEVMMVAVVAFSDEFEARGAVAEIKPFHHAHFLEQVHRAINRRQIAFVLGQRVENLAIGQWMMMSPQDFQNRLARTGQFARISAQPACQRGQSSAPAFTNMV